MWPRARKIYGDFTLAEQMKGDCLEEEDSLLPSENGLANSSGPTGELLLSEKLSELTVRVHHGLTTISVPFLYLTEAIPGTFSALKREGLEGYTVMLSCVMTSTQYAALIVTLETTPSEPGKVVSVDVSFEPTTPNLVQPVTAPSI